MAIHNTINKDILSVIIMMSVGIISISAVIIITDYAYGAITLDETNRREYVYCPVNPDNLSKSTTYEINGCPIVRIYVNNWNTLTELDKSTIDTTLRSSGFKDVGEVSALIK